MRLGIIVSAVMVSVRHGSLMAPLRIWSGLLRQCPTPDCWNPVGATVLRISARYDREPPRMVSWSS